MGVIHDKIEQQVLWRASIKRYPLLVLSDYGTQMDEKDSNHRLLNKLACVPVFPRRDHMTFGPGDLEACLRVSQNIFDYMHCPGIQLAVS